MVSSTCSVACGFLVAAACSLLLTPQSVPPELGQPPPKKTGVNKHSCDGARWTPPYEFSVAQRQQFENEGYVVARHFLSSEDLIRQLVAMHDRICSRGSFSPHWHCKNEDVWARTDFYRDFLIFGPIGRSITTLLGVSGVRIYGDHITEMRQKHPGIFYHFDNIYFGGVLGEFHAQSKGAILFLFMTDVNHTKAGGGLMVQPGAHKDNCVAAGVQPELQAPCRERFFKKAITLSFGVGDALIIHPLMPHATQQPLPGAPANLRRITYLARIVEQDAIWCGTDTEVRDTGKVDCRHRLRPGDKAHDVCFMQIYPGKPEEVVERMNVDWYTERCNVARNWQYSPLTKLKHRLSDLTSQMRIRMRGGTPLGLERAECIYPPEQLGLLW